MPCLKPTTPFPSAVLALAFAALAALAPPAVAQDVNDVSLSALAVAPPSGAESIAVRVGTTDEYRASVANGVSTVTPRATPTHPSATVRVNGAAPAAVTLSTGANTLLLTVTAANGVTARTYTLTVHRRDPIPALPTAQVLPVTSALTPDGLGGGDVFRMVFVGGGETAMSGDVADYNALIQEDAGSFGHADIRAFGDQFRALISTPRMDARDNTATNRVTASHPDAPIYWLGGDKVADNTADFYDGTWASQRITNEVGERLRAQGGFRPVWTGSAPDGSGQIPYRASEERVNLGAPNLEDREIRYSNRDQSTSYALYGLSPRITVAEPLTGLAVEPADSVIFPAFDPTIATYRVTLRSGNYLRVRPTAATGATLTLNGAVVASGALSDNIPLGVDGAGTTRIIRIVATTSGGTAVTYTLNVLLPAATDASLANLRISAGTLTPAFDPTASTIYYASVANTVSLLLLTLTPSNTSAAVSVSGTPDAASPESGSYIRPLAVGVNTFRITVTVAGATRTYMVIVTRRAPPPAPPAGRMLAYGTALAPAEQGVGSQYRLLFVTSGTLDGMQTNIATYNTFVQNAAAAATGAGMPIAAFSDQFRALLSTSAVDARDNTATTGAGVPIYWLMGDKVADNYADFYDGSWDSRSARDGNGATIPVTNRLIMTGSTEAGAGSLNFTVGGNLGTVRVGRLDRADGAELDSEADGRDNTYPLYALSPVLTVAAPDTSLSGLSLAGDPRPIVIPSFASATTNYTARVAHDVADIMVTPTLPLLPNATNIATISATHNGAVVRAPTTVASGTAASIPLTEGVTNISITVSVTDNDVTFATTYTVAVRRVAPPPPPPRVREVLADSPLAPPGLGIGAQFRMLFVTSDKRNGGQDDIDVYYNAFVRRTASRASGIAAPIAAFSSQFRALVSSATVDARDNTATTGAGVPIYWLGGDKVADDYADFYDRSWDSRHARDEAGTPLTVGGRLILTGSTDTGVGSPNQTVGSGTVRIGRLDRSTGTGAELSSESGTKNNDYHLYALSPIFTVVAAGPRAPVVGTPIPDQTAPMRTVFTYAFPSDTFYDLNMDALSYTATGLPSWLTFQPAEVAAASRPRAFRGTPPSSAVAQSPFSLTVTAGDGDPATADVSDTFLLTVIPGAPAAPANVRAVGGDGHIRVSWDAVTDTGGYPVQGYRVFLERPDPDNPGQVRTSALDFTDLTAARPELALTADNGVAYNNIRVLVRTGPTADDIRFTATTDLGPDYLVIPTAAAADFDPAAFITTWNLPAGHVLNIPTNSAYTYSYTVDWGDGGTDATTYTGGASYTYTDAGTYHVAISGDFPHYAGGVCHIKQWGDIQWQSLAGMLRSCHDLVIEGGAGAPDLSQVTELNELFRGVQNFNSPIGHWDVSNVENFHRMFQNAWAFNQDLSNWNVGKVTDFSLMFNSAYAFNQPLNDWNIGSATGDPIVMSGMFNAARVFNQPLGSWDVGQVTAMDDMFNGAANFNQNLGAWDVGKVTTMGNMFNGVTLSTANYDALLSGWLAVEDGETALQPRVTFNAGGSTYCNAIARQRLVSAGLGWSITDRGRAANCPLLPGAFVTTWTVTAGQIVTIPTNLTYTYDYDVDWGDGVIDLGNTGDASRTYTQAGTYTVAISGAFPHLNYEGGTGRTSLCRINQWGDIQWRSMRRSLSSCRNLVIDAGAGSPDLSNVTDMSELFIGVQNFNSPIGHWDVSNVTDMSRMFQNAHAFNQDLSGWDVGNVTDFSRMFNGARAFNQPLAWDVGSATDMIGMFNNVVALNNNNATFGRSLGAWDVGNVTSMADMFNGVTLSPLNYDAILAGWGAVESGETALHPMVNFNAGNSPYCNRAARDVLTDPPNSWRITDGGRFLPGNFGCALSLATGGIADQTYTVGAAVTLVFPTASGGGRPLTHSLTPLPPGLTIQPRVATDDVTGVTAVLLGAPAAAMPATAVTYTVSDADGRTDTEAFTITVLPAVAFDTSTIPAPAASYTHTVGAAIVRLTLPPATANSGRAPLAYTLRPGADIPAGFTFDPSTRTLSGTPTEVTAPVAMTYVVTDANLSVAALTFTLNVVASPTLDAVANQQYTVNQRVDLTLPEAVGGVGPFIYTLARVRGSPVLPPGLSFDPAARTISGAGSVSFGGASGATLRYIATDANGAGVARVFSLTIAAPPIFPAIADQTYLAGTPIAPLTLPQAVGGRAPLTYALRPAEAIPAGLTFHPATRVLTGTPTTVGDSAALIYTVTDSDTPAASGAAAFTITVVAPSNAPATGAPVVAVADFGDFATPFVSRLPITDLRTGRTVFVDRSAITDANGVPAAADGYAYQWQQGPADGSDSGYVDIPGATVIDLIVTVDYAGRRLRARVSFTDNVGYAEAVTSAATPPVPQPPANNPATGAVRFLFYYPNGDFVLPQGPLVGTLIQESSNTPVDPDGLVSRPNPYTGSVSYEWQQGPSDGSDGGYTTLAGETESSVFLTESHLGRRIRLLLSFIDSIGYVETFTSEPTDAVSANAIANSDAGGVPTITGRAQVNRMLTAETAGITDDNGLDGDRVSFDFQWQQGPETGADDTYTDLPGATDSTLTLTAAHLGRRLRVVVSFTDNDGYHEEVTSAPTAAVIAAATPGFVLTPAAFTLTEGAVGTYRVALAAPPAAAVLVAVTSDAPRAVTATPLLLTFTPTDWNTAQPVTVTALQDADGATDRITLTHTAAGGDYAADAATLLVTVIDNDTALVLTPGALSLTEDTTATYRVALLARPDGTVTVTITGDNPEVTAVPSTLTFTPADWNMPQPVVVTAEDDADAVADSATLTHAAAGVDYDAVRATLAVTVIENDTDGLALTPSALTVLLDEGATYTYTAALTSQPTATVTLTITSDALDVTVTPSTLTFTTTGWNLAQTVTVVAVEDADEARGGATITHMFAGGNYDAVADTMLSVTVFDNDAARLTTSDRRVTEGDGSTTVVVRLDRAVPGGFMVDASTLDGTAIAGQDYTAVTGHTLTFAGDADETQTVTVTILDDAVAEGDEALTVLLANLQGAAATVDVGLAGVVTITDNDSATLTMTDVGVAERDGAAVVSVRLDNAVQGGFTVDAATLDGTAIAGQDYTAVTGRALTFAGDAGETQTVTVTILDDAVGEADETLTLSLANLSSAASVERGATATVTITDTVTLGALADRNYSAYTAITPLVLPEAVSDFETLAYALHGAIPAGLRFDPATRTLAGAPTTTTTTPALLTYRATAANGATAEQSLTLTFTANPAPFVTTWAVFANQTITIPTTGGGYDYAVVWGDGDAGAGFTGNATHTYAEAGTYTVAISGAFPRISFGSGGSRFAIRTVEQWGTNVWASMEEAFLGCATLTISAAAGNPDLSAVTSMAGMFQDAAAMNSPTLGNWVVSEVTTMKSMFKGATAFNRNISAWDVAKVTDMSFLFQDASAFNQPLAWDVGEVTRMQGIFSGATAFNQPLAWDVGKVSAMAAMFSGATAFDQDLSAWNITAASSMAQMFSGVALSTDNYNALLAGWGAQAVRPNVNFGAGRSMFCGATALVARNRLLNNGWSITDSGVDPACAEAFITTWAASGDLTITIPTDSDLASSYNYRVHWGDDLVDDTQHHGNATHTYAAPGTYTVSVFGAFPRIQFTKPLGISGGGTPQFQLADDPEKILTIKSWGNNPWTSMAYAFANCPNITIESGAGAPNLTNVTSMEAMFEKASKVNHGIDNQWQVGGVTNMSKMFERARAFNQPIGGWAVGQVTDMSEMFRQASAFNQPIGGWDVSSVTTMRNMFSSATAFNQPIGGWAVGSVTTMNSMFSSAVAFNQPIGGWAVGSVTTMRNMFANAAAFNQDIGGWTVSGVTTMDSMFASAAAFNQDIGGWDVSGVTNMSGMFFQARAFSQNLGRWDIGNVDNMRFMLTPFGLSTEHYGALLRGWSERTVQPDVVFNAGDSRYCPSAQAAKAILQGSPNTWSIDDSGLDAACMARLESLVLNPPADLNLLPVELTPPFDSDVLTYTATTVDIDSVTVTAVPVNAAAVLRYAFDDSGFLDVDEPTFDVNADRHTIDIQVTAGEGLDQSVLLYTIDVTVTYSPTDIALTSIGATTALADDGIDENTPANTEVGVLSATDPDSDSTALTYTLVAADGDDGTDADNATFVISDDRLVIVESPDFETQASYAIRVRVSDGALIYTEAFVIGVNDLDEIADFTITDLLDASIEENTTYTSATPAITTGTPIGALTWSLGGDDRDDFNIVAATGVVTLVEPDFEVPTDSDTNNTYQFTLTATDADGNTATSDTAITVTDDDDERTIFTITDLLDASIEENTTYTSATPAIITGTPIGALTWSLGGDDAGDFNIVAATGVVTLVEPDFEAPTDSDTNNTYQFTLTATDADGNTATSDTAITVTDDDDERTTFTITDLLDASIEENTTYTSAAPAITTGTPIGAVAWSLAGVDRDDFNIVAATGVVTLVEPDFETPTDSDTNNTYEFTLTATDADGNTATSDTAISVTDDDDERTTFTITDLLDASIEENTTYTSAAPAITTGTPIGAVAWSLAGVDRDDFNIVAATGVVTLVEPDFEVPTDSDTNNTYEFTLTATDADGNTATSDTAISVTDATETATFTITDLPDAGIEENTTYTSATPAITTGTPIGAVTWSLGGDDAGDFNIVAATGVVTLVEPDFEVPTDSDTNNTYEFTLTATDADGNTATSDTAISVTDATETATFTITDLPDAGIEENTTYTSATPAIITGTPIGALTWSLGGDDAGDFNIVAATGVVTLVEPDFETPTDSDTNNTYQFTLTATDADGNTATSDTAISVTDATETATFTITDLPDAGIEENTTYTSATPAIITGTPIGALTWSLGGDDAGDFNIVAATGVVTLVEPDFETPTDSDTNNTYQFTLTATDADGNTATSDTAISVTDATETATFTITDLPDAGIEENTTYTSATPAIITGTSIGALTWSLGGDDAGDFNIVAATGVVTLVEPDFETPTDSDTNNTYQFTLTATDADGNTATSDTAISVTDATETATFTITDLPDAGIEENTTYTSATPAIITGTPIGALTWSLGGVDADDFTIDAGSGIVSLSPRDFEVPTDSDTNNTYQFTLIATDADGNANTNTSATTISITDANEDADFTVTVLAPAGIAENTPYTSAQPTTLTGTPIGALTWSLGGVDADDFTIDAGSGIVSLSPRDFEVPTDSDTNNTYQFTLIATDADGNANTNTSATTITITDANEDADFTVTVLAPAGIAENTPYTSAQPTTLTGTPIGALTWSLGGVDADDFTIDSDSGIVSLSPRDFEVPTDSDTNNTYQFTLIATDADGNANTNTSATTITITDANEDADFTVTVLAPAGIAENTPYTSAQPTTLTGTPIGALTWSLGGVDADDFSIDADSGVVSLSPRDFEVPTDSDTNNTYHFTLIATDADGNANTNTSATTITITDANEDADFTVTVLAPAGIAENTPYTSAQPTTLTGTPIGALTWSLGGVDADDFTIDSDSGIVSLSPRDFEVPTDSDTNNTYQFTLIATDADGNTNTNTSATTITITDANEDADFTVTVLAPAGIAENTPYTSAQPTTLTGTPIGALTWSLGGVDADDFTIDSDSGIVSLSPRDFEVPTDSDTNNTYQFTLIATDADGNANTNTSATTITITDANEDADFTVTVLAPAGIAENTPYTSAQPTTLTGTPIGALTWSLGGVDADDFSIDADSGVVSLSPRDFEVPTDSDTNNTYHFTLIATDADGNANTNTSATTITITDANEDADFTVTVLAPAGIAENTPYTSAQPTTLTGTPIGALTWSLGGVDADDFSIDAGSGVVTLSPRDFEVPTDSDTNNTYQFTLIATDADGNANTNTSATTITITDANEDADFTVTVLAPAGIAENTPYTSAQPTTLTGTPIGALTWSLGGVDADDFTIDSDSGIVSLSPRDFEVPTDSDTNNTYQFTLIATDADGNTNTNTSATTITITDANEDADFTVTVLAPAGIAENTPYTSAQPTTLTGTPIGALTWSLGGVDADDFTIDSDSGIVSLSPRDFEVPTDSDTNNTYQFTLIATDADGNTNTNTSATTITITDANEDADFTVTVLAPAGIAENTPYTSAQPTTLTGTPIGALTWSLGGVDADDFSIDADSGVVSLSPRDFEVPTDSDTNNTYHFTLIATDADGNANTNTSATTITITDANEDADFTVTDLADASIAENMTYSSAVPQIESGTPIGSLTWTLGGDDSDDFNIDGNTGMVSLVAPDFENPTDSGGDNTYQFTIIATDADGNTDTSDVTTISVTDATETADFTVTDLADASIAENMTYSSAVPQIESGTSIGSLTWTLGGDDSDDFNIDGNTGMVSLVAPDFENPTDSGGDNTYQFTIIATDADGNTDTSDVTTISVTDATETADFTVTDLADASIAENMTYSSAVPQIESGTSIGSLTWTLGGDDSDDFNIDGNTGMVSLVAPDFEMPTDSGGDNTYQFTITATDADGNTDTSTVTTISVTDETETADFTVPALANAEVMENLTYTSDPPVTAGDPPIGALTWALGGDDAGEFTIAAATGVVTLSAPDFEVPTDSDGDNVYTFTLTATDTDGNTATSGVTAITVTDVSETATFTVPALANAEVMENLTYTSATPVTAGETPIGALTWVLGGDDAGAFTIAATGVVTLSAPDFEAPTDSGGNNTYEFTLTATDTDGNTATSAVTAITVTDVSETAIFTVPALVDASLEENLTYTSATPVTAGDTPIGALTWTLGGDDAGEFTIAATGVVTLTAPDFEVPTDSGGNNTYEFTLTATDTDGNTATSAVTAITVTDVSETATFTVPALVDASLEENMTYTSAPPDAPGGNPVGAVTWTLGGADADDFTIDGTSGVVTLVLPDFEMPTDSDTNNTYHFTLIATDADDNIGTSDITTITITDATETANLTVTALVDASIAENTTYTSAQPTLTGTPIGTVTWTLGGADADDFTIDGTSGVVTLLLPDFEMPTDSDGDNVYTFTLTATDADGNTDTSDITTITVTDATETANLTVPALVDASIEENTTYTSAPPDAPGGNPIGTVTWSLGGADADDFTIDGTSGVVTLLLPDFEMPTDSDTNNTYQFTLIATDADDNIGTSDITTITVTDAVETATLTVTALADASIAENTTYTSAPPDAPGGTPVGAVTWSLGGADADDFTIDGTSGVVTLLLPDFEMPTDSDTNNTYQFTVIATDADDNIGTSTPTTITITDVTDTTSSEFTTARLNEQILARASQAITASTLAAVAGRVNVAADGGTLAPAYQFGGQSSLRGLLKTHGAAMLQETMEYESLLDDASFVLPLRAAGEEAGDGSMAVWGAANYSNLSGEGDGLDWEGEIGSASFGVDRLLGESMLAGVALSSHSGRFDYRDESGGAAQNGEYEYAITNLYPYLGWFPHDEFSLWAAAGHGRGDIEIAEEGSDERSTDATQVSLAGGFNNRIVRAAGLLPGSVTTLNLKSDVSVVRVEVDEYEEAQFAAQEIDSHHLRLLVFGEQRIGLVGGGSLASSLEVGVRYDGGDGVTGSGVEIGAGLQYANAGGNLTSSGNIRGMRLDDYDEWGADVVFQLLPPGGRGLSFGLHPVWGRTQSAAEQLWNDGAGELGGDDAALQRSLATEVGYGVSASMLGTAGVLTPFVGMTTGDSGSNRVRLGGRFSGGNGLNLDLEGVQKNTVDGAAHTVLLRGNLAF